VFNLVVKSSNGTTVTLGQVADIRRTFKDRNRYAEFNGNPTIAIEVVKRIGTNILENNNEVKRIVAEVTKTWPETIKVETTLDQSRLIGDILGSLTSSILLAILLVMTLVVAALGLRSGLMVGVAIPTSFMIGFLFFGFLGYTVNIMLMFGLGADRRHAGGRRHRDDRVRRPEDGRRPAPAASLCAGRTAHVLAHRFVHRDNAGSVPADAVVAGRGR
jgi:multidrug efflux pump subunit AcrB